MLEEAPRTTGEIREWLLTLKPEHDGDAMAYAVRNNLPIVQVLPGGTWGSGTRASYTTAESYLGTASAPADLGAMLRRYLAAFGPASVMDFQFWSGLVKLGPQIEPLKASLRVFQTEDGKDLLDLPDAPLPDEATPAPVRFVPEYDNLVISHKDRTRILADEHYKRVFLSAARVLATFLVDGFVAGTWKVTRSKDEARLSLVPFIELSPETRTALEAEGERLLRFIEPDASTYALTIDIYH